ncbi:hypothetical protein ACIGZJ_30930 [Kitasatospora sp. NPDC052868]|uniref:hypothetical protein n=1 Tax=Kitasatospora sp. NPDC052868 TaxID=3364060 RepID=UPI0037C8F1C9
MTTAREQLLDIRPQSEQVMIHLLDAYQAEICEQIAQEIDAASLRNLRMHPGDDAMVMRRLGLSQAARIARVAGGDR